MESPGISARDGDRTAASLPGRLFPRLPARPRRDLDILFLHRQQRFEGADGDASLPIGAGRSLWLFGDTLLGDRQDPSRLEMPRNTVGILRVNERDSGFVFYWRNVNGVPRDFFPPVRRGEWLWPGTAFRIQGRLYFFLHRFQTDNSNKIESFRFRYVGLHALRVENPGARPDRWVLRDLRLPPLTRAVHWGIACFVERKGSLYLWGSAGGNRPQGTVVARCPWKYLDDARKNRWEYYCKGDGGGGVWSRHGRQLRPLFDESSPEMSLSYLKKQKVYVAVYGCRRTGCVGLRVAKRLMGPWSPYQVVYRPPELRRRKRFFCYAPKAHPELSPSGDELLITYVTNGYRVRDVLRSRDIYFPRFISLPLSAGAG